jgi:hypothetical protein
MQEQQHRLPVIVASDGHPLLDSADRDERSFLDTPGLRLDAFAKDNGNNQTWKDFCHVEAPAIRRLRTPAGCVPQPPASIPH